MDPLSGTLVPLYHPRRHRWEEHLVVDRIAGTLIGLTPVGRATIECLQINRPAQVTARRLWMRLKLFPAD